MLFALEGKRGMTGLFLGNGGEKVGSEKGALRLLCRVGRKKEDTGRMLNILLDYFHFWEGREDVGMPLRYQKRKLHPFIRPYVKRRGLPFQSYLEPV